MAQPGTSESTGRSETDRGVDENAKRKDYLTWEEYYMSVAFLSAQRSKDPRTQVGACIVNKKKRIVGIGYNGMPDRCHDDEMPWDHSSERENVLETKDLYVCHAELNAIVNRFSADIDDSTMYVTLFPCNTCAQLIIQSGIKRVVYASDSKKEKPPFIASKTMFKKAGVTFEEFKTERSKIEIDFQTGKVKINEAIFTAAAQK